MATLFVNSRLYLHDACRGLRFGLILQGPRSVSVTCGFGLTAGFLGLLPPTIGHVSLTFRPSVGFASGLLRSGFAWV